MYLVKKELERFKNFPEHGWDYVIGRTTTGQYYSAFGRYYPSLERLPHESKVDKSGGIIYFQTINELLKSTIEDIYSHRNIYGNVEGDAEKIVTTLQTYDKVFGGGMEIDLECGILEEHLAEITWRIPFGSVKKEQDKFPPGTLKVIGEGKNIVVTEQGMRFVFGEVYEKSEMEDYLFKKTASNCGK